MKILEFEAKRMVSCQHTGWAQLFKLFANVSVEVSVETWCENVYLFFKWRRHILHINNHLFPNMNAIWATHLSSHEDCSSSFFSWKNIWEMRQMWTTRSSLQKEAQTFFLYSSFFVRFVWHDFNVFLINGWRLFYHDEYSDAIPLSCR